MEERNYDLRQPRRRFSVVGWGFAALLTAGVVAQLVMAVFQLMLFGEGETPDWWMWILSFAPMYLVAFPVCFLILKLALPAQAPQRKKLSFKELLTLFPICCCLMYGGNLVGTLLSMLLSGGQAVNQVQEFAMDQSPLKVLVMVILAPLLEELICRKLLIDRIGRYGEKLAVLMSGLIFGLLHGNLFQFFYAFALGAIFAYIYIRSGKLRYSVIFHAIINFMGAVIAPYVTSLVDMELMEQMAAGEVPDLELLAEILPGYLVMTLYSVALMGLSIWGLVLLIIKLRSTVWKPASDQLPRKQGLKAAFLNAGMIVYALLCLVLMVLALMPA